MEPALQRRVQRYGWDKASGLYESAWHQQLKPAQDALLEMAAIGKREKVIDIACGTGLVSFRACETVGPNGYVLGTDISDKMVEIATLTAREMHIENIQFERMDGEELIVEDGFFDVSLCALGLMYMPDPIKALKEMKRVVRHRGRVVVAVWGQRANCGWADIFEIIDRKVSSEVCPMFFNLGNSNMLQKSLEAAGLGKVQILRINTILQYPSDEEACKAAFEGGPVALAFHKFNDDIKNVVKEEYLSSIKIYKSGKGYSMPGEFVVAVGFHD